MTWTYNLVLSPFKLTDLFDFLIIEVFGCAALCHLRLPGQLALMECAFTQAAHDLLIIHVAS